MSNITYAQKLAGERDNSDIGWLEQLSGQASESTFDDSFRWQLSDGSAIVLIDGEWDFGAHADWLDDERVTFATRDADCWFAPAAFCWPTHISCLGIKTTLPMPRFAALNDGRFNLDRIHDYTVFIRDGIAGERIWRVDADAFKKFMKETASWDDTLAPYNEAGYLTAFGKLIWELEVVPNSIWPHFIVWMFAFNEEVGHWSLDFKPL